MQTGTEDFLGAGRKFTASHAQDALSMEGLRRSGISPNRLGSACCMPLNECAGQWRAVLHTNGSAEKVSVPAAVFPRISRQGTSLISHIGPGGPRELTADGLFDGEVVEMEDPATGR